MELAEDVVPVALSALGAFFLFREVWVAQKFEQLTGEAAMHKRNMQHAAEKAELFRTNKREFVIRSVADRLNRPYEEVERQYRSTDNATLEAIAAKHSAVMEAVPQHVERFEEANRLLEESLAPRALKRRRWLLAAGFVLLMLSAALEVAVIVSRHS